MFKQDLAFRTPLMNAAGALGFIPNRRAPFDLGCLGAFVTNPISLSPRQPAENRVILPFAGGFLLHTGLPNPGLRAALTEAIASVRHAACNQAIAVLVGGPLFGLHPEYMDGLGADGVSVDGREAPGLAERLIDGRIRQRGMHA